MRATSMIGVPSPQLQTNFKEKLSETNMATFELNSLMIRGDFGISDNYSNYNKDNEKEKLLKELNKGYENQRQIITNEITKLLSHKNMHHQIIELTHCLKELDDTYSMNVIAINQMYQHHKITIAKHHKLVQREFVKQRKKINQNVALKYVEYMEQQMNVDQIDDDLEEEDDNDIDINIEASSNQTMPRLENTNFIIINNEEDVDMNLLKDYDESKTNANESEKNDIKINNDKQERESEEDENDIIYNYECNICDIQFENKQSLKSHQLSAHKTKVIEYQCREGCDDKFDTPSKRTKHEKNLHIGWKCKLCHKNCKSQDQLSDHKAVHYRRYRGNIKELGICRDINNYPLKIWPNINDRLLSAFGKPYRNLCIANISGDKKVYNKWAADINIITNLLGVQCLALSPVGSRAIALNENNGYMAVLESDNIMVLHQDEGGSFVISAKIQLMDSQKINTFISGGKGKRSRIRFIGSNIYVFNSITYKIQHYVFDEKLNQIIFKSEIVDNYFRGTDVQDIIVTADYLIVLFDRWLGIYLLRPSLTWYHVCCSIKIRFI